MATTLVTGATSMIGGGVVRALAERGEMVRCLQRRPSDLAGSQPGVEEVLADLGDDADTEAVERAVDGCDGVVHVAAKVGIVGTREEFERTNILGTERLLAAAAASGVRRFVHVSSPSVAHSGEPIVGAGAEPPTDDHGTAWYPATKAVAERRAVEADSDTMGVVVVRPHLVWGPGDTQLVGRIVERAQAGRLALVGGGRALVDTTYVDNAVSALVAALDAVEPGARCAGRAYVIANGEPRPIRELVAGICAAAGVDATPRDVPLPVARTAGAAIERAWPRLGRDEEPPLTRFLADQLGTAHWFDPRPARDDLGWTPTVSIDEGLARLAAWYAG